MRNVSYFRSVGGRSRRGTGLQYGGLEHPRAGTTIVLLVVTFSLLVVSVPSSVFGGERVAQAMPAPNTGIDPLTVHVLAIGCCPPWDELRVCRESVDKFVKAAVAGLGIPRANILTVVNEEAVYSGVEKGFAWLKKVSTPQSAVIVYYSGHGVLLPESGGERQEAFCLWSKEFPFAGLMAVHYKIWMTDTYFARLLSNVPGKVKVVVADTCHADAEWRDWGPKGRKVDYGLGEVALLAAAEAGQSAYGTYFTKYLTEAMNGGAGNLKEAFLMCRTALAEKAKQYCEKLKATGSKKPCLQQTPTLEDPRNITPLFRIVKGKTAGSER